MESNINFSGKVTNEKNRVRVYIDWFNFYHNLKTLYPDRKRYQWLDYRRLIQNQLWENDIIKAVYFFTAYYSENPNSERYKRHKIFNQALMNSDINVIFGRFIQKEKTVYSKQISNIRPIEMEEPVKTNVEEIDYNAKEEKKTDVNLAIKIVEDAYENYFDTAYIISCDTDIVPAIELVKKKFPNKKLINVRIANSIGRDIQNACHSHIELSWKMIKDALMDETITTKDWVIDMPKEWKE